MDVWVVGWMGGGELINIIQFCLKIYDLWRHPHPWVDAWAVGWMGGSVGQWVGSGHITKY